MLKTIHQNKVFFSLLPALIVALFYPHSAPAQPAAETVTVVTFGSSKIQTDVAGAKKIAIDECLRLAVQTALTQVLSTTEITDNFESISNLLAAKPGDFVQGYRILKEVSTGGSYRVLLETTVMAARLQAGISRTVPQAAGSGTMPKIIVMIAEKKINDLDYRYWWEKGRPLPPNAMSQTIPNALREKGITIISPEEAGKHTEDLYIGLEMAAIPPDFEAAMFAERLGADLVVVGTAVAEESLNRMGENVRAINGSVDIRVLRADTGEILTTIRETATGYGQEKETVAEKALTDAERQAGEKLSSQIASFGDRNGSSSGSFILRISGENILPHLEKLRRAIMKTKGISTLKTNEMTPNSATLSVTFEGTPQQLADSLLMQSYERFGINITDVSSEGIVIQLLPQ